LKNAASVSASRHEAQIITLDSNVKIILLHAM
jgi:hypothetical protein